MAKILSGKEVVEALNENLTTRAKALVEKYEKEGTPIPAAPSASKETKNIGTAREQADLRLKQEMQKLEGQADNEE